MLVAQGAAQFEIWTGKTTPLKEMSQIVLRKLQF
jgi:shikimate 5-dehydrogenase